MENLMDIALELSERDVRFLRLDTGEVMMTCHSRKNGRTSYQHATVIECLAEFVAGEMSIAISNEAARMEDV